MSKYLSVSEFTIRTLVPTKYVEQVQANSPGFLDQALEDRSGYIDSLLSKRYAVPFREPYPNVILRWLTTLVSLDLYMKRGFNPTDDDAELFSKQFDTAIDELKEAANAQTGLYELPLKRTEGTDTTSTGIAKGYVRSYSETSPFVWKRLQREQGGREDYQGHGTRRGK